MLYSKFYVGFAASSMTWNMNSIPDRLFTYEMVMQTNILEDKPKTKVHIEARHYSTSPLLHFSLSSLTRAHPYLGKIILTLPLSNPSLVKYDWAEYG
jgi:hypothetical protein